MLYFLTTMDFAQVSVFNDRISKFAVNVLRAEQQQHLNLRCIVD